MKASSWNWITPRPKGLSKYSSRWLRALAIAIPWVTVLFLTMMMHYLSGTLTVAKGVVLELPEGDQLDGSSSTLVALVVPAARDTLVFFDDARYVLDDRESMTAFGSHLASRIAKQDSERADRTLVVMADGRITSGKISRLAAVAHASGAKRMLFANKSPEKGNDQ